MFFYNVHMLPSDLFEKNLSFRVNAVKVSYEVLSSLDMCKHTNCDFASFLPAGVQLLFTEGWQSYGRIQGTACSIYFKFAQMCDVVW